MSPTGRPAPTLVHTMAALRAGDDPTGLDLLAVAEWTTAAHVGSSRERPDGTYGACRNCGNPWPCPSWLEVQSLTLKWLVVMSTTAVRASRVVE